MKTKLLFPFILLLAACTSEKPMTDEEKAAVREEGSAVIKEFFDAMTSFSIEKISGMLEDSDDFTFTVSGKVLTYKEMLEMGSQYEPYIESQTFETKFEKYVIVSPACFIYTWHGRNGATMKTGEEIMMEDYFVTYCFRKHAEGWKLFVGHESQNVPIPMDTTAVQ
jgi:ketosteroid isomerase-like protein